MFGVLPLRPCIQAVAILGTGPVAQPAPSDLAVRNGKAGHSAT
jgi:hypothetical protein